MASVITKDQLNSRYFKFRIEGDRIRTYKIPQSVTDGTDTVQFSANWSKQNIPGSTEPMVAFNYVDNPVININLKFHQDMWREAGLDVTEYQEIINVFASLIYPMDRGQKISPTYVLVYIDSYVYRGYFTNIRINQSGILRNGIRTSCEISSTFNIIKKYSPTQSGVAGGFRTYFGNS